MSSGDGKTAVVHKEICHLDVSMKRIRLNDGSPSTNCTSDDVKVKILNVEENRVMDGEKEMQIVEENNQEENKAWTSEVASSKRLRPDACASFLSDQSIAQEKNKGWNSEGKCRRGRRLTSHTQFPHLSSEFLDKSKSLNDKPWPLAHIDSLSEDFPLYRFKVKRKLSEFDSNRISYLQRLKSLNKRKDFICAILSYPMKLEADLTHYFHFWDYFMELNSRIRRLEASLERETSNSLLQYEGPDGVTPISMLEIIEHCLAKFDFDICPYLGTAREFLVWKKHGKIDQRFDPLIHKPAAVIQWAIDSATRQASQYIMEGKTKLIAICGCNSEKVAEALRMMKCLRSKFDVVISISMPSYYNTEKFKMKIFEQLPAFKGTDKVFLPLDEALKSYNFLLLLDAPNKKIINVYDLEVPLEHGCIVIATHLDEIYEVITVDLEIQMKYHTLPWKLFHSNLGFAFNSTFSKMALRLVEKCDGHLLAIILLARALKGQTYIASWELALHEITSEHSSLTLEGEDVNNTMVDVLKFIWRNMGMVKKMCIKQCTSYEKGQNINPDSLISSWLMDSLVHTKEEGEAILEDLLDAFILENFKGNVRMREETKVALLHRVIPTMDSQLNETVILEYLNSKSINLKHNEVSELPKSSMDWPTELLSLQKNHDLMVIPPPTFRCMTRLRVLDLSYTSIKTLPASIFSLISLKKLFLRGCELFMELPPEIGNLLGLEVLDLEGTEIMYLPKEVGQCTCLRQLKVSFYLYGDSYRTRKQLAKIIPKGVLSNLTKLEELSIDVSPNDKQWIAEVVDIVDDLKKLIRLRSLKLYIPTADLLFQHLLSSFKFTVGHNEQRLISRIPQEVEEELKKHDRCLKFVTSECVPVEIQNVMHDANAFMLDRHWTVKKLSEFKN